MPDLHSGLLTLDIDVALCSFLLFFVYVLWCLFHNTLCVCVCVCVGVHVVHISVSPDPVTVSSSSLSFSHSLRVKGNTYQRQFFLINTVLLLAQALGKKQLSLAFFGPLLPPPLQPSPAHTTVTPMFSNMSQYGTKGSTPLQSLSFYFFSDVKDKGGGQNCARVFKKRVLAKLSSLQSSHKINLYRSSPKSCHI